MVVVGQISAVCKKAAVGWEVGARVAGATGWEQGVQE